MTITLSQDLTVAYNPGGYGDSVLNLVAGTQEVNDNLGAFLLSAHGDIATVGAPAVEAPEVAPEVVPEVAPETPAEDATEVAPEATPAA